MRRSRETSARPRAVEPRLRPRTRRGPDARVKTAVDIRALSSATSTRSRTSSTTRTPRRGPGRCSPASSPSRRPCASARSRASSSPATSIVSRYVDAWHVMNIAVDPGLPPPRHRDRAARAPLRADRRTSRARLHARGARLERRRDQPLRALGFTRARHPARLLHRQPRGRPDHVAGARRLTAAS